MLVVRDAAGQISVILSFIAVKLCHPHAFLLQSQISAIRAFAEQKAACPHDNIKPLIMRETVLTSSECVRF